MSGNEFNLKRKRILIIEHKGSSLLLEGIQNNFGLNCQNFDLESKDLSVKYKYLNKNYLIKLGISKGFDVNSSNSLDLSILNRCDALIFIFSSRNILSFNHITRFIIKYREKFSGNKFFPCIFINNNLSDSKSVQSEFLINNEEVKIDEIKKVTENFYFPYLIIENNYNKTEIDTIFQKILEEINKEKNDQFPYNIIYSDEIKLNCCLKFGKSLYLLCLMLFTINLTLSIFDLYLILITPDYLNLALKTIDLLLSISLFSSLLNCLICSLFIKLLIFHEEKIHNIKKFEITSMIFNIVTLLILIYYHFYLDKAENYFLLKCSQMIITLFYVMFEF